MSFLQIIQPYPCKKSLLCNPMITNYLFGNLNRTAVIWIKRFQTTKMPLFLCLSDKIAVYYSSYPTKLPIFALDKD